MRVLGLRVSNMERGPADMLPYLPAFRPMLPSLARPANETYMEVMDVAIADIECVTDTIARVNGPAWYLMIENGANPLIVRHSMHC